MTHTCETFGHSALPETRQKACPVSPKLSTVYTKETESVLTSDTLQNRGQENIKKGRKEGGNDRKEE